MSRYLLTVDVGNSRIKFGWFDRTDWPSSPGRLPRCLHEVAIPVGVQLPWDEVAGGLPLADRGGVLGVIAGANPDAIRAVVETWPANEWPPPVVVEVSSRFPLAVRVEAPRKVGIDRLLNAVAANVVRPTGRAAIIISSGTATTVDLVSAEGAFLGGAILPGFELSARSLHRYTALLPSISMEELAGETREPLGTNTRKALHSGLFWGQLGAVKELVGRLSENQPDPLVLLTGGGASLLAAHLPFAQWEPHLALQGLYLVACNLEQ